MNGREELDVRARTFFEALWAQGDPWQFEHSPYEREKYERQLALLADRRYPRALEIGCGAGVFSRQLAALTGRLVAVDISPTAIAAAAARAPSGGDVEFRVANIMEFDPAAEAPWNLIVMSETVYYLGWLYPFFDVAWLARQLFDATASGGRLLMANVCGGVKDHLLQPWVIRSYRDLFVNVGYRIEREELFRGEKNEVKLDALITRFRKDGAAEGMR